MTGISYTYFYRRLLTREVNIGGIPVGGTNPIRIQSMTNTDTMDTVSTVRQVMDLAQAGSEYVRLAVPSARDAQNLRNIRKELDAAGCKVPLVADVHFSQAIALAAAEVVEKVRINPGNFNLASSRPQAASPLSRHAEEPAKIAEALVPLLHCCKKNGTALRIGVNHGSLSPRILGLYGNTPMGMAVSAMEFLSICGEEGFHDLVFSMKASNIKVTAYATRLLVAMMQEKGILYPIHLGVTEAGDGEDGRIKSAAGMGALLEDGIGDTIRVSLTENPVNEIPVARIIADRYNNRQAGFNPNPGKPEWIEYFGYQKRESKEVARTGGRLPVSVVTSCSGIASFECSYFSKVPFRPEYIYNPPDIITFKHPREILEIIHFSQWDTESLAMIPLWDAYNYLSHTAKSPVANFVLVNDISLTPQLINAVKNDKTAVLVFESTLNDPILGCRDMFGRLAAAECRSPVIINRIYGNLDIDLFSLYASADLAALLVDGLADGIWIDATSETICKFPTSTVFNILQATGDRLSRTDYIACPSCARTHFDIQAALQAVREKTEHLAGLKIAIMGCIVNGPGEMADAHYGYVGSGKGKVNLYKGSVLAKANVDENAAPDELLELIKISGDWKEV